MKNKIFIIVAVLVIGGGVGAFLYIKNNAKNSDAVQSTTNQSSTTKRPTGTKSIVVLTTDNSSLSTFASAFKTAGLTDTLEGVGPYTVLAPTNDAFKALPAGTLNMLLQLENKDKLKNILSYHVVVGALNKSQFTNGQKLKTINGQELTVEIADGKVGFVDAKGGKAIIVKGDLSATNGVVHTVNAVLLPQ
jgi:uncharacterized surface protein with fasciclin (FAS1) repeats